MIGRQKRLHEVYDYLREFCGVHTQTDFAKAIKYSRVYISSAMNGNAKNMTDKLFANICEAFPGTFNLDYLLTGKGTLLTTEEEVSIDRLTAPTPAPQQTAPGTPSNGAPTVSASWQIGRAHV